MPRGNPNIWKKHGASYAELAGTTTTFERVNDIAPRRLPPVGPNVVAELKSRQAAGTPAVVPPRGAGSFVLQTGWTLGVPGTGGAGAAPAASTSRSADAGAAGGGPSSASARVSSVPAAASTSAGAAAQGAPNRSSSSTGASTSSAAEAMPPRTYSTETRSNFGPAPPDFRRARSAGPFVSQMPVPNHPNDWCTSKQVDYRPERYASSQPPQPIRQRDSGRLLPSDVPSDSPAHFMTQQRTHFRGRTQQEARAIPISGCRATQPSGYNIITGAVPYNNNAFEHWDGRDYRRHR